MEHAAPGHLLELSRSIEQIIGTVDKSDGIMGLRSREASVAFFASKGTDIALAKWQASECEWRSFGRSSIESGALAIATFR